MVMSGLKTKFFSQANIDLAETAFIASGVRSQKKLDYYFGQLASLATEISQEIPVEKAILRAQALFQRLWQAKPHRYQPGGDFRLNRVLEAQMSPRKASVGNCLGLTLLYNVLGQRLGLKVEAIHLEEAFGFGPHVFSLLYTEGRTIDIENVLPQGFDYQGHRGNEHRVAWGDKELVADIYLSQGNRWFEQGNLKLAIGCYDRAIKLNPKYERASLNKGIALAKLGKLDKAEENFAQQSKYPDPDKEP